MEELIYIDLEELIFIEVLDLKNKSNKSTIIPKTNEIFGNNLFNFVEVLFISKSNRLSPLRMVDLG